MKRLFITLSLLFVMFSVSAQEVIEDIEEDDESQYLYVGDIIESIQFESSDGTLKGVSGIIDGKKYKLFVSEINDHGISSYPYIVLSYIGLPLTTKIFIHGSEVYWLSFGGVVYKVDYCEDNYLCMYKKE